MPDASDMDLVRAYARHNSESAFTELVQRHINPVYSVALRYVGNRPDAQDIAQAVYRTMNRQQKSQISCPILTFGGHIPLEVMNKNSCRVRPLSRQDEAAGDDVSFSL